MRRARRAIPKVDKEVFRRSAQKIKAVNLGNFHFRGGIRF